MTQDSMNDQNERVEALADGLDNGKVPASSTAQELVAAGAVIVPPPPRMAGEGVKNKYEWRLIPAQETSGYHEYQVYMWVNFPGKLANDIASGDLSLAHPALAQIFLRHNGWKNGETGEEYPQPDVDVDGFWEEIPNELAVSLVNMINIESQQMSFLANKRRTNSRQR